MVFVFYRGKMPVHLRDDGGFEEVAGGECKSPLKVMVVDRACVVCVYAFVNVLAGDGRDSIEEGFPQTVWDPGMNACG
jgi:hypothetical protein